MDSFHTESSDEHRDDARRVPATWTAVRCCLTGAASTQPDRGAGEQAAEVALPGDVRDDEAEREVDRR